jgi:glycosyltransferase involved in cell wall biosynthesis
MAMTPSSVLLVTPRWTRDGGVATHVVSSAAALAGSDVDVHVLAARLELTERIAGVTLHHAPHLFDVGASPEVRIGDARALSPDVIHLHQFEDPDVVSFMQAGSPIVISVHGYSACTSGVHYFRPGQECTRPHGPGCIPNLLLRGCAHGRNPASFPGAYARVTRGLHALRHADLVISYSSAVDRHLSVNGLTRRAIVPLFATIPARSAGGHAARRRVVFAGRVVRTKGVDVLIRAARSVQAEFVICGDGGRLEAMQELARRLGVEERVRFTGWLSAEDLALELAEASVVVMPSLWPEPAGLVGIEAQAAGRPVIASSTGGVGDWLQDGVNGLCVRPGDARDLARALDELLDDPDRQAAMGAAGRQIVGERFTLGHHLAALLQAYGTARATWAQARRAGQPAGGQPQPRASIAS